MIERILSWGAPLDGDDTGLVFVGFKDAGGTTYTLHLGWEDFEAFRESYLAEVLGEGEDRPEWVAKAWDAWVASMRQGTAGRPV